MKLSLFQAFGVELEYMIVDRKTLRVRPVADQLIFSVNGNYSDDVVRGKIAWSNELVNHVIELKTNGPAETLRDLGNLFQANIREINELLEPIDAMLMPTACHPFMNPYEETMLWPHENNEIYALYDKIFDCRGHGWSNLQSTHLNLPFASDEEFALLHAAIRIILPIIPALSASSPILDGKLTGFHDTRLEYYRKNQNRIPSICGGVIPERVYNEEAYSHEIFDVIRNDIRPYDPDGILKKYFLNSRGAIARFDRGAIEIRIIDIQECPQADLAVLELIIVAVRHFSSLENVSLRDWHQDRLREILLNVIREGESCKINDDAYVSLFGLKAGATAMDCWRTIASRYPLFFKDTVKFILEEGSLSSRIIRRLGSNFSENELHSVYQELALCLREGKFFQ